MTVEAYIDRFEEDKAVIYFGDDMAQKIVYPKAFLDESLEEGDYVKITVEYDEEATQKALQEALALTED